MGFLLYIPLQGFRCLSYNPKNPRYHRSHSRLFIRIMYEYECKVAWWYDTTGIIPLVCIGHHPAPLMTLHCLPPAPRVTSWQPSGPSCHFMLPLPATHFHTVQIVTEAAEALKRNISHG